MKADGPVGPSRTALVERVAKSLALMRTRTPSAVTALVGPWGSGKTTVMEAVGRTLKEDGSFTVARYNPWSYSTFDTAITGFFSEIDAALPAALRKTGARVTLGKWVSRLAPLGTLGAFVGADFAPAAQTAADLLAGDQSPETLRREASAVLETLETPILVMIDDLDRLGPDELLMTFRLVRMLGRLPNIYYLLCYDEATLTDVLLQTGLVSNNSGRAHEYLEKMVQLRLDVPRMLPEEVSSLNDSLLREVLAGHSIELSRSDHIRLEGLREVCFDAYLHQPRAAKRLFTQVDAAWPTVAGEVDFVDFLAMTFLRTFEPVIHEFIEAASGQLLIPIQNPMDVVKVVSGSSLSWNDWMQQIRERGSRHPEKIANLLAELFLPVGCAKLGFEYTHSDVERLAEKQRVGHPDFFYRYTQVDVPRHDLSEKILEMCLNELEQELPGAATDKTERILAANPRLVVDKLLRIGYERCLPVSPLLAMTSREYRILGSAQPVTDSISSPHLRLAECLLRRLDPSSAEAVIRENCRTTQQLLLISDALRQILLSPTAREDMPWLAIATEHVAKEIESQLKLHFTKQPSHDAEQFFVTVYALRDFTSPEYVQSLLWEKLKKNISWQIEDVLAMLLTPKISNSELGEWEVSSAFLSAEVVDELLGIENIARETGHDKTFEVRSGHLVSRFSQFPYFHERKAAASFAFNKMLDRYWDADSGTDMYLEEDGDFAG